MPMCRGGYLRSPYMTHVVWFYAGVQGPRKCNRPRSLAMVVALTAGALLVVLGGCGSPGNAGAPSTMSTPTLASGSASTAPGPAVSARASESPPSESPPTSAASVARPGRGPFHPERADIIEGSWLIGVDYPPALYSVPIAATHCGWRVVDNASGVVIDEGDYSGPGPATVWLQDGDLFQTEGCLLWQGYPQLTGSRGSPEPIESAALSGKAIRDGVVKIGSTVAAGRYRADRRAAGECSFSVTRTDDHGHTTVIEEFHSSSLARAIPHYLDLFLQAGETFTTHGCGDWQLIDS